MRRIFIIIAAAVLTDLGLRAQSGTDQILRSVEQNNTTLKALREAAAAEKAENHTELALPDPEVGFNYLWGTPSAIGHRKDASITQSLDFATLSGSKARVARQKDVLVEWQYRADRMQLMLEAQTCCIDLVYYNALLGELNARLTQAETLAEAQKRRLDSGEGAQIDLNNALLNLSAARAEVARTRAEREAVAADLRRLNGGVPIDLADTAYDDAAHLPADFAAWYAEAEAKSPVLAYVRQEVELGKRQLFLSKSMRAPSLSVGYMSEKVVGERFQGLTLGISVPLWSGRSRVRQAKAALKAAETKAEDARVQFYNRLEAMYHKALALRNVAATYRASLAQANSMSLLEKALGEGQISVIDYTTGMAQYYNAVEQALQAERDYRKAYAELSSIEL